MNWASTSMNGMENDNLRRSQEQPLSSPHRPSVYPGGHCYSYYQGEQFDTRVIRMDGDIAHCASDDTDENVISTTILVHNPTSHDSCDDVMNRRLTIVSPPPGFHQVKPMMKADYVYDCVIRERCNPPRWPQRQPLHWGSLWDSMKRSLMQQEDKNDTGSSWMMMGLAQYPTDAFGSGDALPKLEFWFVQGKSKINPTTDAIMMRLDGSDMIRKVHSVAAANAEEEGEQTSKKKQFWVHLIDANVFVAQDSDQVVLAIKKLRDTYGRFCPQGVENNNNNNDNNNNNNNNVIERPGQVTGTAQDANGDENVSGEQSWPGENYHVNVLVSDDVSEDLTSETVSLQDEDDNDSGIYDISDDAFQQLQRRRQSTPPGQSRRRLFRQETTTTTTSTPADASGGGQPRSGRFWTAFSRNGGAPARPRSGTLIDV